MSDEIVEYDENIIMKSHSSEEYIKEADVKYENNVIGLCYYDNNKGKSIYLVTDRLERSDNLFKSTAIHEFGHYLGMTHTTGRSIMQPINSNSVPYPTYVDAVELAKIWKCLPSDFRYFKL
jgi:Zn-dependent peptidase ImmA (M78 family)